MIPWIVPSLLSADFAHLARDIASVEAGGADALHVDVMDGQFVPNITAGPPVVAAVRRCTALPVDVHLMIGNPDRYVEEFVTAGASWISVHVEADRHLNRTLGRIREHGVRAGVAINPATSLSTLDEVLPQADFVLVMSVNPGFSGQRFIPSIADKIRRLRSAIVSQGCATQIAVDGGIGPTNIPEVLEAGAEIVVAGSAVFQGPGGPTESVRKLKEIAQRALGIPERA